MPLVEEGGGNTQETLATIEEYLTSKHMPPTTHWVQEFASSTRLNAPLVALQKTALFRMLTTDITTSLSVTPQLCFPQGLTNSELREQKVSGPIVVQVLDIEDIGRSRWSQVEAIEMEERGEMTKGREVIRVVADADNNNSDPNPPNMPAGGRGSTGQHKLLLQDAKGNKAYAIELESVKGIDQSMSVGAKLALRNVVVARGVILLEPRSVEILGGKIAAWDKEWREERKRVLKESAGWSEANG